MRRSLKHLDQLGHTPRGPLGRQSNLSRLDSKRAWLDRCGSLLQPGAQELIHCLLERLAGTAYLPFEKGRHIVVDGQGGSHIMMFSKTHHDVNIAFQPHNLLV
jgi:hypothetical protein